MRLSSRAAWFLVVGLPLLSCDGSLRLVVVEQGGSGNLALAGKGDTGGSPSVTPSGGAASAEGGSADIVQGGSAGKPDESVAGAGAGSAGAPEVPIGEQPALYIASFVPYSFPDQFVRHIQGEAFVGVVDMASTTERERASFEMSPGLAQAVDDDNVHRCVSFRAVDLDSAFLRHSNSRIYMQPVAVDALFLGDATFCEEPGFADAEGVTFRAVKPYRQRVIHLRNVDELWIDDIPEPMTPEFAAAATFYRQPALIDRPDP